MLPDECARSRPVNIPGLGVNASSGVQNNKEIFVTFIMIVNLSVWWLLLSCYGSSRIQKPTGGSKAMGVLGEKGLQGLIDPSWNPCLPLTSLVNVGLGFELV